MRCEATTGKIIQCSRSWTTTIAGLYVCDLHGDLYEEYRQELGSGPAMDRLTDGRTYAQVRRQEERR